MGKLIVLAVVAVLAWRTLTGRWPWESGAAGTTRQQALFRARKLLGVGNGASHGEIVDAHRRLVAMVHPDRGGTAEQVHEANAARDLLLAERPRA